MIRDTITGLPVVDRDARGYMLATVTDLRKVLNALNTFGDRIHPDIAVQGGDNTVYGPVNRGYMRLLKILFPDTDDITGLSERIADAMHDGLSVEDAHQHVLDANAPMAGYPTEEVQRELHKYRAWLQTLDDGMLDPTKLVGVHEDGVDVAAHARAWLVTQINDCVAALKYRGEPEVPAIVRPEER